MATLKNLKETAIKVEDGMVIILLNGKEDNLDLSGFEENEGCYATNGKGLCFVHEGETFVTVRTEENVNLLKNAGFTEKIFYVPFTNGSYPKP